MNIVNKDILLNNSGNDEKIANELLDMGLARINESLKEITESLSKDDWDGLARSIHRLRPIINFCGITIINDELLNIEKTTKQEKKICTDEEEMKKVLNILDAARQEIENLLLPE